MALPLTARSLGLFNELSAAECPPVADDEKGDEGMFDVTGSEATWRVGHWGGVCADRQLELDRWFSGDV